MKKLIQGTQEFRTKVFNGQKSFFEALTKGQKPEALFITCSDSRLNPNELTQTKPGELFILRNAGNLIPAYGQGSGGEAATIEFGLMSLEIKHIIVCGHSHCGAMKALMSSDPLDSLPAVKKWLDHAAHTRQVVKENYTDLGEEDLMDVTIQENVLCQIQNLKTHPAVAARLARGELSIHAWIHRFESGQVFTYDPKTEQFASLEDHSEPLPARKVSMGQSEYQQSGLE